MKLSVIALNRLLTEAQRFRTQGFTSISLECPHAESIIAELLAARDVVMATAALLNKPEVKAAAMMAPGLANDITRLRMALSEYNNK